MAERGGRCNGTLGKIPSPSFEYNHENGWALENGKQEHHNYDVLWIISISIPLPLVMPYLRVQPLEGITWNVLYRVENTIF